MNEEYREAGYIERTPVTPPIGVEVSWLQKYGPWLLGGMALLFSITALSKK